MSLLIPEYRNITAIGIRKKITNELETAVKSGSHPDIDIDSSVLSSITPHDIESLRNYGQWDKNVFDLVPRLIHKTYKCNIHIYKDTTGEYLETQSSSCSANDGNYSLHIIWNMRDHFDSTIPKEEAGEQYLNDNNKFQSQQPPRDETTKGCGDSRDAIMTLDQKEFKNVQNTATFLFVKVINPQNPEKVITLSSKEADIVLRVSKNQNKRICCEKSATIRMSDTNKNPENKAEAKNKIGYEVEISKIKGPEESLVLLNTKKTQNPTVYIHGRVRMSASDLSGKNKFKIIEVKLMGKEGVPCKDKHYKDKNYRCQLYPSPKKDTSLQITGEKRKRECEDKRPDQSKREKREERITTGASTISSEHPKKEKVCVEIEASISQETQNKYAQGHTPRSDRSRHIEQNIRSKHIEQNISYALRRTLEMEEYFVGITVRCPEMGPINSNDNHNQDTTASNRSIWTVHFRFNKPYLHRDRTPNKENHYMCLNLCFKAFKSIPDMPTISKYSIYAGSIVASFEIKACQILNLVQKRMAFRAFFIKNSKIKNSDGKRHDEGMVPTISIWNQRTASLQTRESFPKDIKIQLACPNQKTANSIIRSIKEDEGVWSNFSIKAVFVDGNKLNFSNKRENRERVDYNCFVYTYINALL